MLTHDKEWMLMAIAVVAAAVTIYFAYMVYIKNKIRPVAKESDMKPLQKLVYNKYYVDEVYDAVIRKPLDLLSEAFYKFFDKKIVDGLVNGVGVAVNGASEVIRKVQTGNISFYILSMVVGIIAILFFTFIK
jgi:NADH-quinone oxidoreductase subunit L